MNYIINSKLRQDASGHNLYFFEYPDPMEKLLHPAIFLSNYYNGYSIKPISFIKNIKNDDVLFIFFSVLKMDYTLAVNELTRLDYILKILNTPYFLNLEVDYSFPPRDVHPTTYYSICYVEEQTGSKKSQKKKFIVKIKERLNETNFWPKIHQYLKKNQFKDFVGIKINNQEIYSYKQLFITSNSTFIDNGTFGFVYKYKDKCIKITSTNYIEKCNIRVTLEFEYSILKQIQGLDFVPKIYGYNRDEYFEYFIMEFIEGDKPTNKEYGQIDLSPFEASLAKYGIIYADFYRDNFIKRKSDGKLFLIDFGIVYDCNERDRDEEKCKDLLKQRNKRHKK